MELKIKKLERTVNGRKYEFVDYHDGVIVPYCEIDGHWTMLTRTFKTWAEAVEWCEEMEQEKKPTIDYNNINMNGYDD